MGLENFTPQRWSAALFVRLRKILVHASTVNRDYEGDIRDAGDQVRIHEIGPITINDHTKYTDMSVQELDSMEKILLIDQAKDFFFGIDDIDTRQNLPKLMTGAMSEAAFAIGDVVDAHIAGFYTGAGNTVSALTVTVGNVALNLSNMQLKLNEANVPTAGRFMPVAPWYHQHLMNALTQGLTATGVPKLLDNGLIVNGFIGRAYGFDLLLSNNVNNNGLVWNHMAYTRQAITHAQQIAKIETVRLEKQFVDAVKGLYLYGTKVVRPNAMVTCATTKG